MAVKGHSIRVYHGDVKRTDANALTVVYTQFGAMVGNPTLSSITRSKIKTTTAESVDQLHEYVLGHGEASDLSFTLHYDKTGHATNLAYLNEDVTAYKIEFSDGSTKEYNAQCMNIEEINDIEGVITVQVTLMVTGKSWFTPST